MNNVRLNALKLLLPIIVCTSCASFNEAIDDANAAPGTIHWPDEYAPESAGFFVHNRIDINAPPEVVWEILIQAETWPDWYEGASDVEIIGGSSTLEEGSVFTWKTMGLNFESTVTEFHPPTRLSWESRKRVIRGYHAWLVIPTEFGSTVITDESQHGFLTYMQRLFVPNKLRRLHDVWLAEIKVKAEAAVKKKGPAKRPFRN
ncbi:MAG: SRPBCC domain-containing protein [Woeseiaceae bacterium]|nr:SRPBCC domain-containing protein [Woeseiaceae bacterium]